MLAWLKKKENIFHISLLKELKENSQEDSKNYWKDLSTEEPFYPMVLQIITEKDTVVTNL